MNSSSVQKQLKAAGIDTNSKKYKAALSEMMKNGNGAMFTNVQAIKNLMSQYDKNGDWIDPNTGLTGLAVTDENRNSYKHIISIPESSREEMFELAKKEFLNENGTLNGDTTKRESVYKKFYRFSDYLGTTSQMSELLGISSISGILRFGRYPAYHGISEPHLAVKSSKTVVENRPYY